MAFAARQLNRVQSEKNLGFASAYYAHWSGARPNPLRLKLAVLRRGGNGG